MKTKKIIKISAIILLSILIITMSVIGIYTIVCIEEIKNLDISISTPTTYNTKFYDVDEKLIENTDIKSKYTELNKLKPYTIDAFLSIEDKDFYKHHGLNYKRIVKALLKNMQSGSYKEGASTITQQLIKNKFLTKDKTIKRKIQEAYLAKKIENRNSKDKILETYLNSIYFGHGTYGIANACKLYFNKEPEDINLNESCILAGLINSPQKYSPIINKENSTKRKNLVLDQLLKDKKLDRNEYQKAINTEIQLDINETNTNKNLYIEYCIEELEEIMNMPKEKILQGDYKIFTYQNQEIQNKLDDIIDDEKYYEQNNYGNIADSQSIILDNKIHGVSAISGKSKYNLVNIKRQPGSLIKPIAIYAPAIENLGVSPKTQILDNKINYDGYTPNNVGNKYYGYVSIEDAVAKSLNIPAVKLCKELGIDTCKKYCNECGIKLAESDNGYAIALGGITYGVSLKEISDSYSVFNNNGNYIKSKFIRKIQTNDKLTLYNNKISINNVFMSETSYIMSQILKYSTKNGTSKKLKNFNKFLASKTGTVNIHNTNYNTDAYCLGYTTDHIVCTWLGNYSMDNEHNLNGNNNGGTYASMITNDIYNYLYKNYIPDDFQKPDGVIEYPIDSKTLNEDHVLLSGKNIPDRYKEYDLFNIKKLPPDNNKYIGINHIDFNVSKYGDHVCINLKLEDIYKYDIYKILNKNEYIIDSIKNKNDSNYIYYDNDITFNKVIGYYIVKTNQYDNSQITSDIKYVLFKK